MLRHNNQTSWQPATKSVTIATENVQQHTTYMAKEKIYKRTLYIYIKFYKTPINYNIYHEYSWI